jgi:hypothetical protein
MPMIRDIYREDNDSEDTLSEDEEESTSKWSLINSLNYLLKELLRGKQKIKPRTLKKFIVEEKRMLTKNHIR